MFTVHSGTPNAYNMLFYGDMFRLFVSHLQVLLKSGSKVNNVYSAFWEPKRLQYSILGRHVSTLSESSSGPLKVQIQG